MQEDFEYNVNSVFGTFITLETILKHFPYLTADYSTGDEADLDQGNLVNVSPQLHEIKISYHPASKCPEQHFGFNKNLSGVSAFQWKTTMSFNLCRQELVVELWNSQGTSCTCEVCKPSCGDVEW